MYKSIRFLFYLFIFFPFLSCSQHVVKEDQQFIDAKVSNTYEEEASPDLSDAVPEKELSTFDGDDIVVADSEEELEEDDEFDDFEEEFSDDEAEVPDPFKGYNRFMTGFNDKFIIYVLKPTASGYRRVIPEFVRRGIHNFFNNLYFPVRLVNNVLQFKFKNAGEETLRFATNTTIGIFGFWDPATEWFGLEAHPEDFGQTLGVWGVGSGPHIVLPFLGPSNVRDTIGLVPSWIYLNPVNNLSTVSGWAGLDQVDDIERTETKLGILALEEINDMSLHLGEYENLKKDAMDLYPFLRDIYEQNRRKEIEE